MKKEFEFIDRYDNYLEQELIKSSYIGKMTQETIEDLDGLTNEFDSQSIKPKKV